MSRPIYLVTGAHGFIGAWVVKRLLASNFKVLIFDKCPDPHRLRLIMDDEEIGRTAFVAGDITDAEAVSRVFGEREITNVIHLAGLQVPTCRANPRLGAMVNVIGTINVFEAARARGNDLRGLVYASSAAVFGPEEEYGASPLDESAPLLPETHYGVFKQCN